MPRCTPCTGQRGTFRSAPLPHPLQASTRLLPGVWAWGRRWALQHSWRSGCELPIVRVCAQGTPHLHSKVCFPRHVFVFCGQIEERKARGQARQNRLAWMCGLAGCLDCWVGLGWAGGTSVLPRPGLLANKLTVCSPVDRYYLPDSARCLEYIPQRETEKGGGGG